MRYKNLERGANKTAQGLQERKKYIDAQAGKNPDMTFEQQLEAAQAHLEPLSELPGLIGEFGMSIPGTSVSPMPTSSADLITGAATSIAIEATVEVMDKTKNKQQ